MPTLSEYLLPFLKIGGVAIFYKSINIDEELKMAKKSIFTLGGAFDNRLDFEINNNHRSLIFIKKVKNTPHLYPRGKNLPKTKPII